MFETKRKEGFTLIELLIVIAIIAILAAVAFVALDPLTRFQDSRDAARWADTTALLTAIKVDQVDNGGAYLQAVTDAVAGQVYMIVDGNVVAGCDDQNLVCDTDVTADANCVNLAGLATDGYLADVPVSPNGAGDWDANITGYTLQRNANGTIVIAACESENAEAIEVLR